MYKLLIVNRMCCVENEILVEKAENSIEKRSFFVEKCRFWREKKEFLFCSIITKIRRLL